MKINQRKVLSTLTLILLTFFLTLTGCQTKEATTKPLGIDNSIPQSGVISKAKMATIAGKNYNFDFSGTNSGIDYTWTFAGKQIQNPAKQDLGLAFQTKGLSSLKKAAGNAPYALGIKVAKFYLAGSPIVTINLNEKWDANHVLAVTEKNDKLQELKTAKPAISTKNGKTVLTFNLQTTGKKIYLVAGKTFDEKVIAENKAQEKVYQKVAEKHVADQKTYQTALKKEGQSSSQKSESKKTSSKKQTSQKSKTATKSESSKQSEKSDENSQASGKNETATESKPTTEPKTAYVTLSIDAKSLVGNLDKVTETKRDFVPKEGWILTPTKFKLENKDTVYDILIRATKKYGIQMEASYTPLYSSYYIEGINQLYEFDAGSLSGWMYNVNGWYPNYGASSYNSLEDGDVIEWRYTKELGHDIGQ